MPLIFISYDSDDSDVALRLAKAFRDAGFDTWTYGENSLPGPSYLEQIVSAIQNSDVMAIVISRESLRSVHVKKELFKGYESGKGLLPILRDLTHAEFKDSSPDFHQALMTNVAITIPPTGLGLIMERIFAGIEAMLHNKLDFSKIMADKPTAAGDPSSTSMLSDPWHELTLRLSDFPPEIEQLRGKVERAWKALARSGSEGQCWKSIAVERVKLVDEIVQEVLDYVISLDESTPGDFALIARGGYGRGFLSEGSDIDITLLFANDIPDATNPFWIRFEATLTDVWGIVPYLQVSPLATTVATCAKEWREVFSTNKEAIVKYVSFAYSRCIAGNDEIHRRLRQEWRDIASEAIDAEVDSLRQKLSTRLQTHKVDQLARSFHLKNDAGGVLEFRLTGFVEQFLSCRSTQFAADEAGLVKAHEFFLVLRDQLCRLTRTPLLAREDVPRLRQAMERELGASMTDIDFWDLVVRQRRKVRAGFKAAIDALANRNMGNSNHEAN